MRGGAAALLLINNLNQLASFNRSSVAQQAVRFASKLSLSCPFGLLTDWPGVVGYSQGYSVMLCCAIRTQGWVAV